MLPADDLTLAIDIQARSYKLLLWLSDAVDRGFVPLLDAHDFVNVHESALKWVETHYLSFPPDARPDRRHVQEFSAFFSTYLTTSFEFNLRPGTMLRTDHACYCPFCSWVVKVPHLRVKKVTRRDRKRVPALMADRLVSLSHEEGVPLTHDESFELLEDPDLRRPAAYSTYGHWLIKCMSGISDGVTLLALWREIAWNPSGSPIRGFALRYKDFVDAEETLVMRLRKPSDG